MKRQCTDPQPHPNPNTFNPVNALSDPTQQQSDPKPNNNNGNSNLDGASIETQRRPRGRPVGSKNKPKSPNSNPTRKPQPDPNNPTNQHHILEILNGADVIDTIAKHSLRHNTSFRVLHATGAVANLTLHSSSSTTIPLPGRFNILSLAAVFVTPSIQPQIPIGSLSDVAVTVSCSDGPVVGGFVVGPLIASGSVFVLVEVISGLTYHRLEIENVNTTSYEGGGGVECGFNVGMYSAGFMPY